MFIPKSGPVRSVLLVATNVVPQNDQHMIMPTQLDYLAAQLRGRGIHVECLDLSLIGTPFPLPRQEQAQDTFQHLFAQRAMVLSRTVAEGEFDLVGLSFRNLDPSLIQEPCAEQPIREYYLSDLLELSAAVRQANEDVFLVLGGPAYSLFPETLLRRARADYGIVGAGEAALAGLVESINQDRPPLDRIISRSFDFSSAVFSRGNIDLPAYHKLGVTASLQTKRGCAHQCNYCNYPALEGRHYQLRPATVVVDEMEALMRTGFEDFYFLDAVFNSPLEQAKSILREIIRRQLDVRLEGMLSPHQLDEEFLDLAEGAGFFKPLTSLGRRRLADAPPEPSLWRTLGYRPFSDGSAFVGNKYYSAQTMKDFSVRKKSKRNLILGIDAGDDQMLQGLGKSFDQAAISRAAQLIRARGIPLTFDLLLGGPGTTLEGVKNTLNLALEAGADTVNVALGIRVYPRTGLAAMTQGSLWHMEQDLLPVTAFQSPVPFWEIVELLEDFEDLVTLDYNFR